MKNLLLLLVLASSTLVGCTALENDLQKGFRYGSDSASLTKKTDQGRTSGELPRGINAYLWRAAMDSVGFLPLEIADPQSGKIVTQWYSPPAQVGIRSRMTIEILDPDLRRDTIRVTVARQTQDAQGLWLDSPTPAGTAQSLEDSIYTKARDIAPY